VLLRSHFFQRRSISIGFWKKDRDLDRFRFPHRVGRSVVLYRPTSGGPGATRNAIIGAGAVSLSASSRRPSVHSCSRSVCISATPINSAQSKHCWAAEVWRHSRPMLWCRSVKVIINRVDFTASKQAYITVECRYMTCCRYIKKAKRLSLSVSSVRYTVGDVLITVQFFVGCPMQKFLHTELFGQLGLRVVQFYAELPTWVVISIALGSQRMRSQTTHAYVLLLLGWSA